MQTEDKLREYLRKATANLQKERERTRQLEAQLRERGRGPGPEPLAVVGMGCRWPGGISTPAEYWQLLVNEREGLSPFPRDRGWSLAEQPSAAGAPEGCSVDIGGFLIDAAWFDAEFFGVTDDEATGMDPQQRLLLETAWEAVENAGIDPVSLRDSDTAVFVGVSPQGYGGQVGAAVGEDTDPRVLGTLGSVASGRVSYVLGLRGPTVTVDTACSSALVAVHLAGRALQAGECSLALAAAATVMARPDVFVEHSRQGALAGDGCSKPFAAAADGGNWAEGVGVIVLERLSDAQRHGHSVLAVLRGSAINHTGESNGLAVPNGPAQERVIARALADAGLDAADVDLVEGHGTGTPLGDVIEAEALLAAYGRRRRDGSPLLLGSVKSNFGHTQAAAGLAGLMKVVLALHHGVIPASLYAEPPLDAVDWDGGAVRPIGKTIGWPQARRPRRAGVTAIGAGGTCGHVVLEQAPSQEPVEPASAGIGTGLPWLLSGRTGAALAAQADRLLTHLAGHPEQADIDLAYSLATTRTAFQHRAAISGGDRAVRLAALRALRDGADDPRLVRGTAGPGRAVLYCAASWSAQPPSPDEFVAASALFADLRAELAPLVSGGLPARVRSFLAVLATARWWVEAGVSPAAAVGAGIGVPVARHLRGEIPLDDAVRTVLSGPEPAAAEGFPAAGSAGGYRFVVSAGRPADPATCGDLVALGAGPAAADGFPGELAHAHVAGITVNWARVFAELSPRRVELPNYAFQRRHFWHL